MSKDVYQIVTDQIIQQMETAGTQWAKPWVGGSAPISASTGKKYNGINRLLLGFQPYSDSRWGTYKAWQALGGQVRKGEKGSLATFWKVWEKKDKETGEITSLPCLRYFTVFNAQQVEGIDPEQSTDLPCLAQRISNADQFVARTGATIKKSRSAFYSPGPDHIGMPSIDSFTNTVSGTATEHYYSTLLHELTHWTGSSKRLDRLRSDASFGNALYAKEELIAELGAAFLCSDLGINNEPREDHAKYLNNWLTALRNDKKLIISAAGKASRAVEYLHNLQTSKDVKAA